MLIYSVTSQTGADTGAWFHIDKTAEFGIRQISITLSGTSATIEIYGRIGDGDDEQLIWTGTASEGISAVVFPQMRVKLSAATAANVDVALDGRGRDLT